MIGTFHKLLTCINIPLRGPKKTLGKGGCAPWRPLWHWCTGRGGGKLPYGGRWTAPAHGIGEW
jgi:hypothetical protein